jgi:nitroreductase
VDVFEAIQQRYSVRSYLQTAVPEETLERILEAARLAPSARNAQNWRFVIVTDDDKRKALCDAAGGQKQVAQAPVVVVACADTDERLMACGQPAYTMDVAIALEHVALQATAEGLGTCWIGAFLEDAARQVVGAPSEVRVVQLMTLGYPAGSPKPKSRKPLSEIVMREQWGRH